MMHKKAFFFTMIVIVILGLFLASFSIYNEVSDRTSIQKRVETMNNFMSGVEKDLSRKLYISTYRVIFLAENKIIEDGYISDLSGFFNETFIDGTVDGQDVSALNKYTVSEIVEDINRDSNLVGADFNIEEEKVKITISQEDPWHVKATLLLNMSLVDQGGLASIYRADYNVSAYIPITNFEDPVYFIGTSGGTNNPTSNQITKSPYENHFSSSNLTNLSLHANNSYYIANPSAPSFLKRLKGDLTADTNGIESFVNTQYLSSIGITACPSKSVVDYICFGSSDLDYYTVTGMPSWFKIDDTGGRLALYQVTGLTSGPF